MYFGFCFRTPMHQNKYIQKHTKSTFRALPEVLSENTLELGGRQAAFVAYSPIKVCLTESELAR